MTEELNEITEQDEKDIFFSLCTADIKSTANNENIKLTDQEVGDISQTLSYYDFCWDETVSEAIRDIVEKRQTGKGD